MSHQLREVSLVPEGDGVDIKRLFPLPEFMNYDPFVLWDHFSIDPGKGFPEHPHRGFEGLTYLFSGGMQHRDNLGNDSLVEQGGAQRFNAGHGIVHSEIPTEPGKSQGIQLWVNLPQRLKQQDPDYQQVDDAEFPFSQIEGGQVKHIVGNGSPLVLQTRVEYQHIQLQAGAQYHYQCDTKMRGLVYALSGDLSIDSRPIVLGQAILLDDVNALDITAASDCEFMLCLGVPHGEPIHQHGPYVD